MNPDQSEALRKRFSKDDINQIPRKNNKTGAIIKLDYVGHAAVTDRLLEVDPSWTWEPMGKLPTGAPALDYDEYNRPIGMWINLTVCGVTRPGYGYLDQPAKKDNGAVTELNESVKQLISDAIRNAAMRFGVALDLWKKEDKHVSTEGYGERNRPEPRQTPQNRPQSTQPPEDEGQATLSPPAQDAAAKMRRIRIVRQVKQDHKDDPRVANNSISQMSIEELQQAWPEIAEAIQ